MKRPAVLAALLLSTAAFGALSDFEGMDIDGDGRISAKEHFAAAERMFQAMDANRDGTVTATEMAAAQRKVTGKEAAPKDLGAKEKIKAVDANGDGVLNAKEHAQASRMMFRRMDADKDGSLSKAELEAGHAALKK